MDPRIANLASPDACEKFLKNAIRLGHQGLAEEARQHAIELRAQAYGAESTAEHDCLQAIYGYEEVLSQKNGRRTRASRTWQMVKRHGILAAAERALDREDETIGYTALVEMGLQQFAFEAVIVRHPDLFSSGAATRSRERMDTWKPDVN